MIDFNAKYTYNNNVVSPITVDGDGSSIICVSGKDVIIINEKYLVKIAEEVKPVIDAILISNVSQTKPFISIVEPAIIASIPSTIVPAAPAEITTPTIIEPIVSSPVIQIIEPVVTIPPATVLVEPIEEVVVPIVKPTVVPVIKTSTKSRIVITDDYI